MTDRELMQQALEAAPLSDYSKADGDFYKWWYSHMQNDLMQPPLNEVGYRVARYIWDAALRSRLEQPEQDPVAWVCYGASEKHDIDYFQDEVDAIPVGTQLYASPPQRQPLTDEHIDSRAEQSDSYASFHAGVRFAEAAHGIKGEA